MMIEEQQARRYDAVFNDVCNFVAYQRRTNPTFTLERLQELLDEACVREGNNWVGRGEVSHIVEAATIAAYEHALAEWKTELGLIRADAGTPDEA